jgi:glucokinase
MTGDARPFVLAADIGGTSMRGALVAADGAILRRDAIATEPARGFEGATERLSALLARIAEGASPVAAGIATAGPVDPETGTYAHPPNLPGWHGRSMVAALQQRLGVPVVVGHDATLAALGEARFGSHRGVRDLVYLTLSTGIGAGIIAGERPITGSHGGAGEAGHLIVEPGGPRCGAGCPGCLEGVASGIAIAAEAGRRIEAGERSVLPPHPTAAEVFAAADAGDALALAIVERATGHIASGIASLLALLDPEVLIVGGGLTTGLESRWEALLEAVRDRALPRYRDHLPVELTTLGDDASLLGAAVLALERIDASGSTT